jgi:hypothetical protein
LFTLIRDTTGSGLGLLDKLAQSEVSRMLVNGDVSSLTLPAGILTSVNAVIASTGILPADRFASLSAATQRALREAYLDQRIGNINLTYPDSTGTQTVFHGLLNVRLDNIDFDIDINNTPVLTSLNFDSDSINLSLSLPMASGKAFMSRWPTALYWAAVAISGIACLFLPFLCWLTPFALTVGVFILLDFAFVSISLSNIKLDAHIRFVPNAANVLQPDATLTFDADVNLSYSSVVPTGVHQILSALYSIVGSKTDIIVSVIESQLQDKLNTFVKQDLALTYPPAFGPVTLSGISNQVAFADMDNLYIEQGLNAGTLGVINPYITQVDSEIKNKLLILRNEFKVQFRDPVDRYNDPDVAANLLNWTNVDFKTVARYYLGTVISQNFLNHYIHTLWRNQAFNYDFSPPEASQLFDLLAAEVPGIDPGGIVSSHVHLFPAVSPRTVLTPKPASEGGHYSTTFFDDIRLCFEFISKGSKEKQLTIEFLFAAQAYSEIGFGSLNRATGKLDLLQINDRLFDIYFDLERIQVQVIHPEIQSMVRPDMPISVFLDYSALNNLQSMFKLAAQFALASRNNNSVPRLATDSIMTQRYDLAGKSFGLVMQLTPYRGNIYVNKGMSGVGTAIYEGALNIDTLDELTATLIRLFI